MTLLIDTTSGDYDYTYLSLGAGVQSSALLVLSCTDDPEAKRSACVYCPYHSDSHWQWMKDEHPTEFAKAVEFDEGIRDMTMRGSDQPGFVHRSCVPLSEATFDANDPDQVDMFNNECEGMCGV
tara:strand:+ start:308 stop:679 length:372 start_codon:yes stop_codon:yes gene_type:complete